MIMALYTLAKHPRPMTTAVIQVAEDGTATLHLGKERVEHAVRTARATVMRVLVDYAAALGTGVRVTTQMPDGGWTRHRLEPDGTLAPLPQKLPTARSGADLPESDVAPVTLRRAALASIVGRVRSRSWLIAMQVLLLAALLSVLATT